MGVHANRIECMQVGMRDGGIFCRVKQEVPGKGLPSPPNWGVSNT